MKSVRFTGKRLAALALAATTAAACSTFGGGATAQQDTETAASIGQLATECARLQPLYGPNDRELTRKQMDAALTVEYAKWDADGNGELGIGETEPLNDQLREQNVGASPVTDWNADGHIDVREFGSGWRTMFDLCDSNRNEIVSLRELGFSPNVTGPRLAPTTKPPEGSSERPKAGY